MAKILVISPSQTFRRLIERAVANDKATVLVAVNKLEALAQTFTEQPDVVVVALESWSESVEIMETLHQRPENKDLPLVVLRPNGGGLIEQMKARGSGASLYLRMPTDPAVIGAKLMKLIAKSKA